MNYIGYSVKRAIIIRAEHGSDIIHFIKKIVEETGIRIATFTAIGALKNATLAFYNQETKEYQQINLNAPQEIACCIGNITSKNKNPFVHAHAVLADDSGSVKAGHLLQGIIFASEIHLYELEGPNLNRTYDQTTGLSLLDIT